jgi:hypothetical protein
MSDFASIPPSKKQPAPEGFFQGGLMPAERQNIAALLVIDIRSLRLTTAQGRKLEESVREHITHQLRGMKIDIANRSAIDLSSAVFGFAIE